MSKNINIFNIRRFNKDFFMIIIIFLLKYHIINIFNLINILKWERAIKFQNKKEKNQFLIIKLKKGNKEKNKTCNYLVKTIKKVNFLFR